MLQQKIQIGLIGRAVSGKDTVGKYLVENYGFTSVVTGQLVRDYIAEHNLGEPTRPLMVEVANAVRAKYGADYFLQKALSTETDRLLIDGLRATGEVDFARDAGCIIIAVDAPIEKRYDWSRGRGRVSDEVTFEAFVMQEESDSKSNSSVGQNLDAIIEGADYSINNIRDLAYLFQQVDELMSNLGIGKAANA